ncbi:MAG TPA: ester cyclase, partial [Burkholderiales bacterium]|nr:ester cyclase [Burkholderiales bacterium]
NVEVALRFKKSQGTQEMPQVEREVLAPNYDRVRGGNFHLASNARDQGFPAPGMYLRAAFPDRVDIIEEVIAEDDRVGLLFRVTGTHTGNFFGIPPTGKKVDVYEIAMLRIVDGQMVEGWIMMDETALLQQLGAKMPPRKDGQVIAPPLPSTGEDADAFVQLLLSHASASQQDRNKLVAASSRLSKDSKVDRATNHLQRRFGFHHLREYGKARGLGPLALDSAFPDRRDRIEALIAEGDQVWMRFNTNGTHQANLYGVPATGRRIGVSVVAIMSFTDGKWKESWTFADELGMLSQLGAPNLLLG